MDIKAVIFDFGGVVVEDVDEKIFEDISNTFRIASRETREIMEKLLPLFQTGGCNEEEFWHFFSKAVGREEPPAEYKSLWLREYMQKAKPKRKVMEIIAILRHKGYKVGALSNTIPPHADFNQREGRFSIFNAVALSCDKTIQAVKPHERIYAIAAQRLGYMPDVCLYIDDKEEYLKPAHHIGMEVLHFTSAEKLEKDLGKLGLL